ncbi:MAG TPA: hypothetical protein VNU46_10235 [Gemmatimonadaceae bacterium]|jgi:hypothetical protein|nr:hypothetical protein [Gemmatimonadaceae bacterium]
MLSLVFSQIALAAATMLGAPNGRPALSVPSHAEVVVAGRNDKTALDILNNARPDILARGAARRCPPVTALYVDGHRRVAPAIDHGFSRATLYFAGDTVMVMLPPSVADALRTVPAKTVHDIRYMDCQADLATGEERNMLFITTK